MKIIRWLIDEWRWWTGGVWSRRNRHAELQDELSMKIGEIARLENRICEGGERIRLMQDEIVNRKQVQADQRQQIDSHVDALECNRNLVLSVIHQLKKEFGIRDAPPSVPCNCMRMKEQFGDSPRKMDATGLLEQWGGMRCGYQIKGHRCSLPQGHNGVHVGIEESAEVSHELLHTIWVEVPVLAKDGSLVCKDGGPIASVVIDCEAFAAKCRQANHVRNRTGPYSKKAAMNRTGAFSKESDS
jgi:hypothetical protein